MFLRSSLVLAVANMAYAAPLSNNMTGLSLLDIVAPELAIALKAMIDNSSDWSYLKPDLSDVNILKVITCTGAEKHSANPETSAFG